MNFNFAALINPHLEVFDIKKAINIAENKLKAIPKTDFHEIIGKSLVNQSKELAQWLEQFYLAILTDYKIKSFYIEMNEFDINTDAWYLDCFAYEYDGGLTSNNIHWLSDIAVDTVNVFKENFKIIGFEKFQKLFENAEKLQEEGKFTNEMSDAFDWCEQIIIIRFIELVRNAHLIAKEKKLKWSKHPLYFTEHGYDFIVKSKL